MYKWKRQNLDWIFYWFKWTVKPLHHLETEEKKTESFNASFFYRETKRSGAIKWEGCNPYRDSIFVMFQGQGENCYLQFTFIFDIIP